MSALSLTLNGAERQFTDDGSSLLDVLREQLGCHSVKDGCSPQGQCGCCTVWVDGAARAACVTPARRAAGRAVTTVEGLPPGARARWADAFVAAGASQCGFCTPGIVMRLAALEERRADVDDAAIRSALLAHLCRCTGWNTVVEAAGAALGAGGAGPDPAARRGDAVACAWRAQLEGPEFQSSGPDVVLGAAPFADDTAPAGALVALPAESAGERVGPTGDKPSDEASYVITPTLAESRRRSGKVQGRRSTVPLTYPVPVPDGAWALTLQTTWVEPAYLEPDASWCRPGGVPASPLANGGAFGGKRRSPVPGVASVLADRRGAPVRVLWPREAVVRQGPKRPPVGAGIRADGRGVLQMAATGSPSDDSVLDARVGSVLPLLAVSHVAAPGPPAGPEVRCAGWAEAWALRCGLEALGDGRVEPPGPGTRPGTPGHRRAVGGTAEVTTADGARARVSVGADDTVAVEVWAGELLDRVTLRSYCMGAVHQALGWVWSEGIAVDGEGEVQDLTIRSFGILSARDTPAVDITLHPSDGWPVGASDAVLAATAAAAWIAEGLPPCWPTRRAAAPPAGPR